MPKRLSGFPMLTRFTDVLRESAAFCGMELVYVLQISIADASDELDILRATEESQ